MLKQKILFYDIETHYVIPFSEIPDIKKEAFRSHGYDSKSEVPIETQYMEKAGLTPEFGYPICVSFGYEDNIGEFRLSSVSGIDTPKLLTDCARVMKSFDEQGYVIAGYNSKGFDNPFMAKHYIMNGMKVPKMINSYGKKPWEVSSIDIMDAWKLGSWSNTSLQVAAASLGVASKTEDVTGVNLWEVPIENMDWPNLVKYCEEDVRVEYEIYKRLIECVF